MIKLWDIVKYTGPTISDERGYLENGENARVSSFYKEFVWVSNINQPFCGSFCGWIDRKYLKKVL